MGNTSKDMPVTNEFLQCQLASGQRTANVVLREATSLEYGKCVPAQLGPTSAEWKTLRHGTSTYPDRLADTRGGAVERRAPVFSSEYTGRARRLDAQSTGTPQGCIGSVAGCLDAYRPIRALVFGHFLKGSPHLEDLLTGCAHSYEL